MSEARAQHEGRRLPRRDVTRTLARRIFALALLALLPAACGRSCGCTEGKKTYETLDGKVKVALVRNTHWTGGRIGGPVSDFAIRVETTPPFEEPVPCDHVDMAEDDAGKHVAFRCRGTSEWTLLRLRGGDRRIRECSAPMLGTGRKPEFDKVDPVRAAAVRILDCNPDGDAPYTTEQVARAVLEDEGEAAATDFVVELAARPFPYANQSDSWERAFGVLPAPARDRALGTICGVLTTVSPLPKPERWMRAVLRCPLDPAAIGEGALAMFSAALAAKPPDTTTFDSTGRATERALLWSALLASARRPAEASAVACTFASAFGRYGSEVQTRRKRIIGTVLARTRVRCPAADVWLAPPPCSSRLDCDGSLCTAKEITSEIATAWAEVPLDGDAGSRAEPLVPDDDRLVLLLTYGRGALPRDLVLKNQRRLYPFADAGTEAACSDDELDAGAPCACQDLPEYARCRLDPEKTAIRYEHCAIHVNDAKHQLDDVRRVCEPVGASCDFSSVLCCGGLRCKAMIGGTGGVCEPISRRDAAPSTAPVPDGG
jgi:hypothetical protein